MSRDTLVCEQRIAGKTLSAWHDGDLPPADAQRIGEHITTCAACQAHVDDYDRIIGALQSQTGPRAEAFPWMEVPRLEVARLVRRSRARRARGAKVRTYGRLSGLGALAAVLLLAVYSAAGFHFHGSPPSKPTVTTPAPALGSSTDLTAVSMISPTEGWAIGVSSSPQAATGLIASELTPVILLHYHNGTWQRINTDLTGWPTALAMDSPTDGWALVMTWQSTADGGTVGFSVMLHFDGHLWNRVDLPLFTTCQTVTMIAPDDGWAGCVHNSTEVFLHYDGRSWAFQPEPVPAVVVGLSFVSAHEGWAVGNSGDYPPGTGYILHFTGGRWAVEDTVPSATFDTLSMASGSDGWALGLSTTIDNPQASQSDQTYSSAPLLLRYGRGRWTQAAVPANAVWNTTNPLVSTPNSELRLALAMLSPSDGWLLQEIAPGVFGYSPLLHWDGAHWSSAALPATPNGEQWTLLALSFSSPDDGWAVGERQLPASTSSPQSSGADNSIPTVVPLLLHYAHGIWSVYTG